jgi:hypothetical protein
MDIIPLTPQVGPKSKSKPKSKPRTAQERAYARAVARRAHKRQKKLRAQVLSTDPDAILSFREWCAINGFSVRQGQRILQGPGGPKVTMLTDKKIGISRRANSTWLESRSR